MVAPMLLIPDSVSPHGDTMDGPLIISGTGKMIVIQNAAGVERFSVDTSGTLVSVRNGYDFKIYSDSAGSVLEFFVDGSTGDVYFGDTTTPSIKMRSGSPEGSWSARIGSIYIQSDGTGAAAVYVKTSGTGNTGWDAVVTLAGTQTLTNKTLTDPTFDKHVIAGGSTPALAALAAAGTTATVANSGKDIAGQLQVTPNGAGIAAGSILTVTFALAMPSANYAVLLTPASAAARTLGLVLGPTNRSTTAFDISTAVALTAGSVYQWHYAIVSYG